MRPTILSISEKNGKTTIELNCGMEQAKLIVDVGTYEVEQNTRRIVHNEKIQEQGS